MKLFNKKLIKGILISIAVLALIITVVQIRVYYSSSGKIFDAKNAPNSQAAIILGAYVSQDGSLCDMLQDRVITGVELYKSGKVDKLLLSGDHGRVSYDEVNNMRKYAETLGVPTEDIFMDHAGFSTYESMYRAKEIFNVKSAIIVTQKFHMPRALYIADKIGVEAAGVNADRHIYYGSQVYSIREILARVKAVFQVTTNAKPTFLGEQIPIDGDGRATHDIK